MRRFRLAHDAAPRLRALGVLALLSCSVPVTTVPKSVDGVRSLIDTTYYAVPGSTPREWIASSAKAGARAGLPPRVLAMTGNVNKWVYAARPSEYGCEPHDATVILGITFVIPRLASDSGVSPGDLAAWQALVRYLWLHEETHAAIAARSAVEFRDSLRVLHAGECGLLESHVAEVSKAVTAKYQVLQRALDDRENAAQHPAGQISQFRGTRLGKDTTFRDSIALFRPPARTK